MGNLAELVPAATTVVDPRPRARLFHGARALVVVRPFLDEAAMRWLGTLRGRGCKLIGDFDDLLFAGEPSELPLVQSGAIGLKEGADRLERYRSGLCCFDAFTVSTEPLQQELRRVVGLGRPVRVVPNRLSVRWVEQGRALYPSWRPGDPRVMRYLPGSPSHDADFATIVPALVDVLAAHDDLSLEIVGPLSLDASWFPEGWLTADRVRRHGRVSFEQLARLYASSWLTLAPLAATRFAQCKSAIKFLESAAFAAPCVAAPSADMLAHEGGGALLAEGGDRWVEHVEGLRDDERRVTLGAQLRSYVDARGAARESAAALHDLLDELGVATACRAAAYDRVGADAAAAPFEPHEPAAPFERHASAVAQDPPSVGEAVLDEARAEAGGVGRQPAAVRRNRLPASGGRGPHDVLAVSVHGRHPALRSAVQALQRAWRATGGGRIHLIRVRPGASNAGPGSALTVGPRGDRAREVGTPWVELRLASLVRPAVMVSFAQPYGGAEARRSAAVALSTVAWDSLDDLEPWRMLSRPLADLPRLGTPDVLRPWRIVQGARHAQASRATLLRWPSSLFSRLPSAAHRPGSEPLASAPPVPACAAAGQASHRPRPAEHARGSAEGPPSDPSHSARSAARCRGSSCLQEHLVGGWPLRDDGLVWWPSHPRVVAALLGRAAEVIGRDDALCFDALRAGVPVRDPRSGLLLDKADVAGLVPALAGLIPASLGAEPELWRLVATMARAVAHEGARPAPLLTPVWIERGRARRAARARQPRSGLERARRRYDKLLRDPRRFLADSRFAALRAAGKMWPAR